MDRIFCIERPCARVHAKKNVKGDWYRAFAIPDYRYTTPHSTLDPKEKTERSKIFSSGYALSSLLRSEEHMDRNIGKLLDWMDQFSHNREPMDLDRFLAYTAFDNVGEAIFSESFGFISSGQDVRGAIKNNLTLTPYVAVAGFYYWLYVVFVANPVITWTGIMPMGHLFDTARTALDRRKENPDARFDMVAHWLRAHQRDPKRLSIQDIEAQTMANVGAGSDTVTSRCRSNHPTTRRENSI
ncbi:hypothetical protein MGN70_010498 [Eutypa lata]|nr:hypothetical protein MGN70_010498 [Eutypa lata]